MVALPGATSVGTTASATLVVGHSTTARWPAASGGGYIANQSQGGDFAIVAERSVATIVVSGDDYEGAVPAVGLLANIRRVA